MARLFDDASSQALVNTSAILTVPAITMAAWFRSDDITADQIIMAIYNNGATDNFFALVARGTVGGDPVSAWTRNGGGGSSAGNSATGFSANTWHHGAAVFASTSSRTAYIDGLAGAADTTLVNNPTAPDRTAISTTLTGPGYMSGRIAEAAIWNVALDAGEILALGKGVCPLMIRPQSLQAYWPLFGNDSPELDRWKASFPLTLVNAPTKAEHGRIIYPNDIP